MRKILSIEKRRKTLTLLDQIPYTKVMTKQGEQELMMSVLLAHGNVESRLANGIRVEDYQKEKKKPAIIILPGGGYRGSDKNLLVPEMTFLAEAGYVVAFIYYRGSSQALFPAQLIDVKTAIRFLKRHSEQFHIDKEKIGVMGRSAGGHLAVLAGMNDGLDLGEEYLEESSDVQCVCDWFGPVDVVACLEKEKYMIENNPDYRWKNIYETHPGALLGEEGETLMKKARYASPFERVSDKVAPMLILHGDRDRHVPWEISEKFYDFLVKEGFEQQTEYYLIENADHGSDEFFQEEIKQIMLVFFKKYLG